MALWLVRGGKYGERESLALEKGLAIIGWEELPDLSGVGTREELYELLEKTYPDGKRKTLLNYLGQLWAFIMEMQPGDLVALPLKSRLAIALGEVVGPYQYRPDLPLKTKHTRPVKWMEELPRSAFDKDLLYSLGAFMTVCRIQRNNAEERVRALLAGKLATLAPMSTPETGEFGEWETPPDLEQYARDQIRDYIARKFKGHDLARLVGAMLEAQGYKVQISPEGADGGVDILAGYGPMGFDSPRLVVQVDAYDRRVVAWDLSRFCRDDEAIRVLEEAVNVAFPYGTLSDEKPHRWDKSSEDRFWYHLPKNGIQIAPGDSNAGITLSRQGSAFSIYFHINCIYYTYLGLPPIQTYSKMLRFFKWLICPFSDLAQEKALRPERIEKRISGVGWNR